MTCHHSPGDPECGRSTFEQKWRYFRDRMLEAQGEDTSLPVTPDAENFEIEDAREVGNNLVLKVKYPNCDRCAFEGTKVMVFLGVKMVDVFKWKRIDPHFRDPSVQILPSTAPSPAARFPGSVEGWHDALAYTANKSKGNTRGVS